MYSEPLRIFCLKIGLIGAGFGNIALTPWDVTDILLHHAFVSRSVSTMDQEELKSGRFCFGSYMIQYTVEKTNNSEIYQLIISQLSNESWFMAVLTTDSFNGEFVEVDRSELKVEDEAKLRGGLRWSGPTINGKPYGLGMLFSSSDHLVYFGLMLDDQRVIYGKEFRDEQKPKIVYEGGFVNGIRYGRGISYKEDESEDYQGEWLDNHPVPNEDNN